eukprot:14977935-Alexandrium_andersonii.AAC.1
MSASLVGSEMCIRDRHAHLHNLPAHLHNLPGHQPCLSYELPSCWGCPVSYTHLTLPTICSV